MSVQAVSDRPDGGRSLLGSDRPLVMGILNITPDSFSDGGEFLTPAAACQRARQMVAEGCDIIDIGGESTRPGAVPVTADDELARVVPVIRALAEEIDIPISIDTSKAAVMYEAVNAGARMINDVRALQAPGALAMAASLKVDVCLMHMRGEPHSMQTSVSYDNVSLQVEAFLRQRLEIAIAAGIERRRLIIDPGFGFGKRLGDNLLLLQQLDALVALNVPVLVGLSRKSMIDHLLSLPVDERLSASLALALLAVIKGARIVRVHDVKETVQALRIYDAVCNA